MHKLIASPFLDTYLNLQPDSAQAIQVGKNLYNELIEIAAAPSGICPPWLIGAAR